MNPNIPFETLLQLLTMAYMAPLLLLIAGSNVFLAIIETFEEADKSWKN